MGLNASVFRLAFGVTESSTVHIDLSKMWDAFADSGAPRSWQKFRHLFITGSPARERSSISDQSNPALHQEI
jgi:hypothetical protein